MRQRNPESSVILGSVIIVIGLLFLGRNLGWFDFDVFRYVFKWYNFLILAGVISLARNEERNRTVGIGMIGVGAAFWLMDMGIFPHIDFRMLWPLILIAIGVSAILRARNTTVPDGSLPDGSNDYINDTHVFSFGDYAVTSNNFKGGKITTIFGGGEYNLLRSRLSASGNNVLDIFVMFGGVNFIVPPDWEVRSNVTAVFGGFSERKRFSAPNTAEFPTDKILYIKGLVLFGGGEIRRHKELLKFL